MPTRQEVFAAADKLWTTGRRPSVRSILREVRGSTREVAPLLRTWWIERSTERRIVASAELADLESGFEARFDEQRRHFLLQIDAERQRNRELEVQLAAAQSQLSRYRKLLGNIALDAERATRESHACPALPHSPPER